jgi:3-phenylpropionate/cinnamic acid dioxygenase small subunit
MQEQDLSAKQHAVEQFLYHEAQLLDDGQLKAWFGLFSEDATYRVPSRETVLDRTRGEAKNVVIMGDFSFDLINDTYEMLRLRVKRLDSGLAHVEQPEAVTVRYITNIRLEAAGEGTLSVRSNFHIVLMRYERSRSNPIDQLYGHRTDVLVDGPDGFKIRSRLAVLAQPLVDKGLSVFL